MSDQMVRACVVHGAGDVRIESRPIGVPRAGEVAVRITLGGICGSDLHYYHRGGVGDFRLREPMILGHEVVGVISSLGPGADGPAPGTPVAVHPATPCGACPECRRGQPNVCRETRYLGSAARSPHTHGGLSEVIAIPARQVFALPNGLPFRRAVLAEPLSVALHAVRRAGVVRDRRILVTGAGPIGCLVVAVLRAEGAAEVVVTDLLDQPLTVARSVGASAAIRAGETGARALAGEFDVAIEASGSPTGLATCIAHLRPGGRAIQLGMLPAGDVPIAGNVMVTREISLVGAFRFGHEFGPAIDLLADGLPVDPVISHIFPLAEAVHALDVAADRQISSKVLLDLTEVEAPKVDWCVLAPVSAYINAGRP